MNRRSFLKNLLTGVAVAAAGTAAHAAGKLFPEKKELPPAKTPSVPPAARFRPEDYRGDFRWINVPHDPNQKTGYFRGTFPMPHPGTNWTLHT